VAWQRKHYEPVELKARAVVIRLGPGTSAGLRVADQGLNDLLAKLAR
jgi:hypothetical protein